MKAYEITVLLIEPNLCKRAQIEEILDYVGLSGRNVREKVVSREDVINCLNSKAYNLIVGSLPSNIHLSSEQIHIEVPNFLDVNGYIQFLSSLTKQLEEKFGFNYT